MMYRVSEMGHGLYGKYMNYMKANEVEDLVETGCPTILVSFKSDLEKFGIDPEEDVIWVDDYDD